MIGKLSSRSHEKVAEAYDKAYKSGAPFRNPPWFVKRIVKLVENDRNLRSLSYSPIVLDIGCGDGHFLRGFANVRRLGVDISPEAIKKAVASDPDGVYSVSKAEKLLVKGKPVKPGSVDYVLCMGSLEHFVDMSSALSEMRRVLRPGGLAVIHVPNSSYLVHRVLGIKTQHQMNERLATEPEWNRLLSAYFSVERVVKYNPRRWLSWLPSRYSNHFTFFCRKPVKQEMKKSGKNHFGAFKGIGSFTNEDEMKGHDL